MDEAISGFGAARRPERLFALGFCAALLVASLACLPFRLHVYGVVPHFFQTYGIVLGTSEALTAIVLLWRARTSPAGRQSMLAAAYALSAPLVVANVVMLPDVVFPRGTFPFQAPPWTWVLWHVGWGVAIAAFALAPERGARRPGIAWLGALAAAAACIVAALRLPGLPPLLLADGSFAPTLYAMDAVALVLYAAAVAALAKRWRALTTLELWVGVAVVALALDVAFNLSSPIRFSLGTYLARALGMISGVVVLGALVNDLARLVRRAEVLDRYAVLTQYLPQIAFILDRNRRCLFVNQAWTELTGQRTEDAIGFGYQVAAHPDDLASSLAAYEDGAREVRLRDAGSGLYRRHAVQAVPIGGSFSTAAASVVTAIDIEDRALAMAAIEESDARLRIFLETVPQIVWTADASGWIDWYNSRWFEYTGQTPEEAAGWGWQVAHHAEDFPAVMERWPHSIATGEPFDMEFRLRRRDGEFRWFLTRVVPLRDEAGTVVRWYGSNTDIDVQKRAAQRSTRVAQTLQEAFLPERLPQHERLRFDAVYLPAESEALVGGDWYDAVALPDGRILISCGDVAGHGLDAAVLAGRLRQGLTFAAVEDPDPARVLARVNHIAMFQQGELATAVVAVLDPERWTMTYALAGHPAPVVALARGDAALLPCGGIPLGVLNDAAFENRTVALGPDAVVVFYTDGVTEFARDIGAAERALVDAAAALVGDVRTPRPAVRVKERVLAGAAPRDDAALLVVQCSSVALAELAFDPTALVKRWRFHSSDPLTAHNARRDLIAYLSKLAADGSGVYEAELVLGEILANTVEHAPGLVEIEIDWTGERPIASVRDTGPGIDAVDVRLPADAFSEDGRGMFLINALAADVRISRSPGYGTLMQCTLPLRRGASPVLADPALR